MFERSDVGILRITPQKGQHAEVTVYTGVTPEIVEDLYDTLTKAQKVNFPIPIVNTEFKLALTDVYVTHKRRLRSGWDVFTVVMEGDLV
jgi:hypothetical protein